MINYKPIYMSGETRKADSDEITIQRIARGLYNAAADMDREDYTETREEDINRLSAALAKLNPRNPDDSTLLKALELIYT